MNLINSIESQYLKSDIPDFSPGDRVRVRVKVIEGEKERIQSFEGTVIKIHKGHSNLSNTFTVRRVSFGIGAERTFPWHSPRIENVEVTRRGSVRRAKLYYLRNLSGKAARIKEAEY